MFLPRAMSEVEFIVPAKDALGVTRVLSAKGIFHQVEAGGSGVTGATSDSASWQERASAFASLERRLQGVAQTLGVEADGAAVRGVEAAMDLKEATESVDRMESDVKRVSDALVEARRQLESLEGDRRRIEPVADLDFDMAQFRSAEFVVSMLGTLPASNVSRIATSLGRIPHALLVLRQDPQKPVVWLATARANRDVLERAAKSAYFEGLDLPVTYKGRPAEVIRELDHRIAAEQTRVRELQAETGRLARQHRESILKSLQDIHASRIMAEAILKYGHLRHTFVVIGWVPSQGLGELVQRIRGVSKETLVQSVPADRRGDKRNVPVALQGSKWLKPFQSLVTTYARPRYGEVDPTWLLALTFPLLFGAMFGDVGHGLLLAGFGWLLTSRKIQSLHGLAGLGGLITACGLAATVFGFLYGSVFGFEEILHPLWLQPSEDPLTILAVAVGAGLAILTVGFTLGILNAARSAGIGHVLFGHTGIVVLVLFASVLGMAASAAGIWGLPTLPFAIAAGVAALCIWFSELLSNLVEGERPLIHEGIVTYVFQGFMELFEVVISLLSNSLSYVRIGAFAIAHVVLSSVVFLLAGLLSPGHGVVYWIVVALGTVVIVGYEGLIVGIQAMRLSYYEFFSKFFAGGGIRFEPLTLVPEAET
jgi:V/A-type H+-transporting ATPase subunit I